MTGSSPTNPAIGGKNYPGLPPPSPPRSINMAGPGDGAGSRWGWIGYIPPHPRPLPPGERGIFDLFST